MAEPSRLLLPLLCSSSMMGPAALNILLPSLPGLPTALGASKEMAQTHAVAVPWGHGRGTTGARAALGSLRPGRPVLITARCSSFWQAPLLACTDHRVLIAARIVQAFGAVAA